VEQLKDGANLPQLVLELARGRDRFRARWNLRDGVCTLARLNDAGEEVLGSQPTALKNQGTFSVRFANVDERLLVWVDGQLPFGDGVAYAPPRQRGPTENDLRPAGLAVQNATVSVRHLHLWRDTYYTLTAGSSDARQPVSDWTDPHAWDALRDLQAETFYVQPNHFLCMGDNSPDSYDSRSWGLVPRRLLLGRALIIYYPLSRIGPIR
jgi:signal peptidase I